ncbi:MAG: DNA ligase D [Proteobacteria bacterium]|nr:DNA ligase D [Pseudomonadota bacterium]
MPSPLDKYRAKRRFNKTPEPEGGAGHGDAPIFVIQKHHARRMHYDLRLEIGGTLKSWAVPEGPCLDPKVRRFAKLVEDHPLDYASFEGRIPAGNYGAGTVIVWDRGTWVTLADDAEEAIADGELKIRLSGEKLSGGWTLVRLPDDPSNWLLIKERDIAARPLADYDVLVEEPNSVVTGKPVDEVSPPERKPVKKPKADKIPGARASAMPKRWSPQLATSVETAPKGKDWLCEIKYDGYRTLAFFEDGQVRLITRNGHDWTERYKAVAKAFAKLPCKTAIVDGEVCVQDPRGITSLNLLEATLEGKESHALIYYAFDLCYLDGYDLSHAKLTDRRAALQGLIDPLIDERSPIQFSDSIEGDAETLFAQASRMGLEGIVCKKVDAPYVQRRSETWQKVKRVDIDTFTVIGYLSSAPKCVTSLVLAEERDGELQYACRAGSGISEAKGRALYAEFSKAERSKPVIAVPKTDPKSRGAHWIEPNWSAEIAYRTRSSENAPRAPVVLSVTAKAPARKPARSLKPKLVGDRELAAIHLTNPEREMFEGSGVTKLDIALHYARVGDWALPELLRRPLTIFRCTTGHLKDCFYQRHAFPGLPDGVETIDLKDEEGRAAFITVTQPKGYLALAQFGAIELHLWGCKIDDPEHPDRLVIDLDPDESLPWARVCDAAEILKTRLETMGLHPFLRTTGGKGLHLVMALKPGHDWPTVKGFAEAFSRAMAADSPSLFTAVSSKERRKGRIYLDYLRNGRGASAVASYSLRARPGFPVATPISWAELRTLTGGSVFNRINILKRLETLSADPWDGLGSSSSSISPQARREVGLKK